MSWYKLNTCTCGHEEKVFFEGADEIPGFGIGSLTIMFSYECPNCGKRVQIVADGEIEKAPGDAPERSTVAIRDDPPLLVSFDA